jgi:hypothetical protein
VFFVRGKLVLGEGSILTAHTLSSLNQYVMDSVFSMVPNVGVPSRTYITNITVTQKKLTIYND